MQGSPQRPAIPDQPMTWPMIPAESIRKAVIDTTFTSDPRGLLIQYAHVRGPLDLGYANIARPLTMVHCEFTDVPIFAAAKLKRLTLDRSRLPGIRLDSAEVSSGVSAEGAFFLGQFNATGMMLTGQLNLNHTHIHNASGIAVALDGSHITGSVAANGIVTSGSIRAIESTVTRNFDMTDASVSGGLNFERTHIGGALNAASSTITNQTKIIGCTIDGPLTFAGSEFLNSGGRALSLDGSHVHGNANLRSITAAGTVRANQATIEGRLVLTDSQLGGRSDRVALELSRSIIGAITFRETLIIGTVELPGSTFGTFDADALPSGSLDLTGWHVKDIRGILRNSWREGRRWLRQTPDAKFSIQPWLELAAFHERVGQTSYARLLRAEVERTVARRAPWPSRVIRQIYGAIVGYGYYPLAAFGWLAILMALTALTTFNVGHDHFVAASPSAASAITQGCPSTITAATTRRCVSAGYPVFNDAAYAITSISPAGALSAPSWLPQPGWLATLLTLSKMAGWILTALAIAGVTGLLRRR